MTAGCLGAVGDMCDAYGTGIKHMINQESCAYLINKLKHGGNPKYDSLWEWSANVKRNIYILIYI